MKRDHWKPKTLLSRFGLKLVGTLLLVSLGYFFLSIVIVRHVLNVATSLTRKRAQEVTEQLTKAAEFYPLLVAARKRVFRLELERLARDPALSTMSGGDLDQALEQLLDQLSDLAGLSVLGQDGTVLASTRRPVDTERWRTVTMAYSLPNNRTLRAGFLVDRTLERRYVHIGKVAEEAPHLRRLTDALQPHYYPLFLKWYSLSLALILIVGLTFARRIARRVTKLSQATERVARGDLDVTVPVTSKDELGMLADTFNEMVREVKESQSRIAYLEKVGTWQEIARRLAHEIKNPLTPIQLSIQQIEQSYRGDDERFARLLQEVSEIVGEEIAALRRLVEEFSTFARLPEVQPQPVEVEALLDEAVRRITGDYPDLNVTWRVRPAGLKVQADRDLFKRVLHNLLENSYQAAAGAHRPARVTIMVRRISRGVIEWILEDEGPGIPPEIASKVFDPYFTTREDGTGLGLAIVKKVMLEHRGSISVESRSEGGARFVLLLPEA